MPVTDLPVTKFTLRHPEGNKAQSACVHFITYGLSYGPTQVDDRFPTVLRLDLSQNQPPPQHLCERFTGLNEKLRESFFSIRENDEEYHRTLKELKRRIQSKSQGDCVAVLINCTAGMHRSVSMAERLKEAVSRWDGFKAECLHLDIGKGEQVEAEMAAMVVDMGNLEAKLGKGSGRSRHKAPVTSEARVSEKRPTGAAPTADAALPRIEAPLRKKSVSWRAEGKPHKPHSRQRETVGMQAGSREKDENGNRRLSF